MDHNAGDKVSCSCDNIHTLSQGNHRSEPVLNEMKHSALLVLSILCVFLIINSGYSLVLVGYYNHNNTHDEYGYSQKDVVEARRRKHKFQLILPLVVSALLVKSIVFPLAVKAMAVMSSVAVLLSFMSLIISSIIGYAKLAYKSSRPPPPAVKIVYVDKPLPKHIWSPQEEVLPPLPILRTKYIQSDPLILENEEPNIADHYHTFLE